MRSACLRPGSLRRPRGLGTRARLVTGLLAGALLATVPGTAALAYDSGEVTGLSSGSNWEIVLRLLVPTVVLFLVLGALAALPRLLRRPRYRPGKPWPHDPLWFAGAENPERALTGVRPARRSGGASADW